MRESNIRRRRTINPADCSILLSSIAHKERKLAGISVPDVGSVLGKLLVKRDWDHILACAIRYDFRLSVHCPPQAVRAVKRRKTSLRKRMFRELFPLLKVLGLRRGVITKPGNPMK